MDTRIQIIKNGEILSDRKLTEKELVSGNIYIGNEVIGKCKILNEIKLCEEAKEAYLYSCENEEKLNEKFKIENKRILYNQHEQNIENYRRRICELICTIETLRRLIN